MSDTPYLPADEAQRLLAVRPYVQLPTKRALFQAMVQLTARLFTAPISIMSLVESNEVQYPGNIGLPNLPARLARQECICSAAVYTSTTTVFPDLWQQPCPWVSPAAQAQTDFQFYAGHPLLTRERYAIGTLCVLDEVPRTFSAQEQVVLQQLAELAMRLLDLHLALHTAPDTPWLWDDIEKRLTFSIQRLETLTLLAQRTSGAAAAAYQQDIHHERQLILADINFSITQAFPKSQGPG